MTVFGEPLRESVLCRRAAVAAAMLGLCFAVAGGCGSAKRRTGEVTAEAGSSTASSYTLPSEAKGADSLVYPELIEPAAPVYPQRAKERS